MMEILSSLFKPIAGIIGKRQDRKAAKEAAGAKLVAARQAGDQKLELNKDEWEHLAIDGLAGTWKDEYITVSVVSIFNVIVLGGLASAFGYPQILAGIGTAIQALTLAGVDVGFLLEATILAGLGLSVWKKF